MLVTGKNRLLIHLTLQNNRWSFLQSFRQVTDRLLGRKQSVEARQTEYSKYSINPESGLQKLIDSFGEAGSPERQVINYPMTKLYPAVMEFIDNGRLAVSEELRKQIRKAFNDGNKAIIVAVFARFLDNLPKRTNEYQGQALLKETRQFGKQVINLLMRSQQLQPSIFQSSWQELLQFPSATNLSAYSGSFTKETLDPTLPPQTSG